MTEKLFEADAYLRSTTATITAASEAGIVLDRTNCYPLGGGQPGDTGKIVAAHGRTVGIQDTRKGEAGTIVHVPAESAHGLEVGDKVTVTIDWDRRYAHMRMHTALHLLGAVLKYGVTGGQVGAERSRLDFDTQDEIDKERVTAALNALIEADHEVGSRYISDEELAAQPELVRTMSVKPPTGAGRVRLLEIVGVDLQPCGGTHVARTGEIGRLKVAKVESKGRRNKRVQLTWG